MRQWIPYIDIAEGDDGMPTTLEQRVAFQKLKEDMNAEGNWKMFWSAWDGFLHTIIRKKLYFAPSLWEEAKALTDMKLYKYIGRFDETREISPWLARVVASACEDVKSAYGYKKIEEKVDSSVSGHPVSIEDGDILEWMNTQTAAVDEDEELRSCLWLCVEQALDGLDIDRRQITAFMLFYRHGRKLREIAETFHMSATVVNNWPRSVLNQIMPEIKMRMAEIGYFAQQENKRPSGRLQGRS